MEEEKKASLCLKIREQVDAFITDWEKKPTLWLQEIDVQYDLAQRIHKILKEQELDVIEAKHSHYQGMHKFSRVTCEPYVSLGGVGTSYAHPDIVVWDDSDHELHELNSGKWPMIWACEIKYTTGEPDSIDLDRLRQMLKDEMLYAGCWLKLLVNSSTDERSHDTTGDSNLWIVEARATIAQAQLPKRRRKQ